MLHDYVVILVLLALCGSASTMVYKDLTGWGHPTAKTSHSN